MKKNFQHLLVAGCLATALVSCGNKQANTSGSATEAKGDTLCLMSYNSHNGVGLDEVRDYNRFAGIIKGINADVVAIQEVDSVTGRHGDFMLQDIATATGMYPSYGAAIDYNGGKYGIGILSKEKPLNHFNIALPGREEKRTLLVAEFDKYLFCCVHLSLTDEDQVASVPLIKEALKKYNKPVFIAGDLNADPASATMVALKEQANLLTNPEINTFPADSPNICIDYILQLKGEAPAVTVLETDLVKGDMTQIASDHAPVFAKVVL